MFGKEKGPARKPHDEHAAEAWKNLKGSRGPAGSETNTLPKANVHAVLAIYALLNERLPIREQPPA